MPTPSTPNRVAFTNIIDGTHFFDCSPIEARKAVDYITDLRKGQECQAEAAKLKCELKQILEKRDEQKGEDLTISGHLSAKLLAELFTKMETCEDVCVTHVVTDALGYAGLRLWDRDCMDIETKVALLKEGRMSILWGANVCVSKDWKVNGADKCLLTLAGRTDTKFPLLHTYRIQIEDKREDKLGKVCAIDVVAKLEQLVREIRG